MSSMLSQTFPNNKYPSIYHACELLDIDHIDKSEKKPNIAKIPFL